MIRFNNNVYHGLNTAPKSCLGILRTQRFLRKSSRTNRPAWCYHTVYGRNPAAVDMVNTQYFRSYRSVVCSFRGMLENLPPNLRAPKRYVPGTHPLAHASGPRHRTPHASLQLAVGFIPLPTQPIQNSLELMEVRDQRRFGHWNIHL